MGPATLDEVGEWQHNYLRVEQFMTTDLFTVHEDDLVDLAANLMDWERIRHVPVEDEGTLWSVSSRTARAAPRRRGHLDRTTEKVSVRAIMRPDPITVTPRPRAPGPASMRERVGALPVVDDDKLVGIVTEHDFMNVAGLLLLEQLDGVERG